MMARAVLALSALLEDNVAKRILRKRTAVPIPANTPPIDISLSSLSHEAGVANGTVVGFITGTDLDPGDTLSFSLQSNPGSKYSIVGDELRVAASTVAGTITITIRATDLGAATLDVNFDIVATAAPGASDMDALEAEMIAWFDDKFQGHDAVVSWVSDVVVTSPSALQTRWTAIRTLTTQNHRIRCRWNGLVAGQETTGVICSRPTVNNGWWDDGGACVICADSLALGGDADYTPQIGGQFEVRGVRGLHVKGLHFVKTVASGQSVDSSLQYATYIRTTGSFPGPNIVMFENCTWGVGDAGSPANWAKAVVSAGVTEDLFLKNCTIDGAWDGITSPQINIRVHGCDFKKIYNDCHSNFSFTNAAAYTGVKSRAWVEGNTYRDYRAYPPQHGDVYQTGTSLDIHYGYDELFRKNVVHLRWPLDAGVTAGGTQGSYPDDYKAGRWRKVWRNNILALSTQHGLQMLANADDHHYSKNNTLVCCGEYDYVLQSVPLNSLYIAAFASGSVDTGFDLISDSDIYGGKVGDNISSTRIVTTNDVVADPRPAAFGNGTTAYESVFEGTFTRVPTSNFLTYTVANEVSGTQTQFRAAMWALFEPKVAHAGKGCPDPTGFGAP
jgi:hypothetical protein